MAVVPRWYGGYFYYPMCDWLEAMLDFWFPAPVEVDMDGAVVDKAPDIPETVLDSASYLRDVDTLPDIPPMYRAESAALEAQLIVRGRSISRPITDGRVVR